MSTRIASHIANGRLGRDAVNAACATLGGAERTSKLKPTGSGWLLAAQLDKFGSVAAATFAEWWVVETFVDNITEYVALLRGSCVLLSRLADCRGLPAPVRACSRPPRIVHGRRHMAATFPGSNLVERHDQQLRFQLPESDDHSLGDVFGVFEQEKARLHIAEYVAGEQTTNPHPWPRVVTPASRALACVAGMR